MNNIGTAAVMIATWCVAAPLAQQQRAPQPKATPAHNVFIVTGCVEAVAEAATPTFKLTDASSIAPPRGGGDEARSVGTSGSTTTYELRPVSGVTAQGLNAEALKAHLGQRVEMVVRPIESAAAEPPRGVAGAQATKPIEPSPEPFSVTEIKGVIGTCS